MDIIKKEIEIKKFYVINSKLILSIYENGKEKTFMTTIRDFSNEWLFIDPVSSKGNKVRLSNNESICLSVAKLGAIWIGESEIKRYEKSPVEGYWIKYPKEIMKVQRRQFLRLDSMIGVTIKYFKGGLFYSSEKVDSFDISGCGIGLVSEKEISKTLEIQLEFQYKDLHFITPAEVIHSNWNHQAELYYTGLRFLGLQPEETDKLHKRIIQEQLYRRKMGNI